MSSSASLRQRVIAAAIFGLMIASSGIQAQSSDRTAPAASSKVNYGVFSDGRSYDEFIIHYNRSDARSTNSRAASSHLDSVGKATGHQLQAIRDIAAGGLLIKANRALKNTEMAQLMETIAKDAGVDYVEPNAIMMPLLTPNDTRFGEQWHYAATSVGMKATTAWDVATGTGIRVAVLDTGITSHTDLNANVIAGYDFVSNATNARDGNGRDNNPLDQGDWNAAGECGGAPASNSSWHGSHVAGTIAAVTNNASGVAGVAYNARIVPVRVLAKCGGSLADIADAITWSSGGTVSGVPNIAAAAQVINMSLGGSGSCGTTYQNAINGAVGRGTIVVVAAGNSNVNASNASPANCSNVVTVAATGRTGGKAYYSNFGTVVDLAAPGGDQSTGNANGVLSTVNGGTTTPSGTGTYAFFQGTSMAAPHVAGVAALVLSQCSRTPAQLETLLKASVDAFPATCSSCGTGLINARKAVDACGGTTPPPPPPPTTGVLTNGVPVTGLSGATGAELRYTIVVPSGASNLNIATSGGTGDADLYVRLGSAPTTTTYTCRPYLGGNAETCTFAAPTAGTYHIMVRGYSAFSGVTLTGSYSTGGGTTQPSFFENQTDYTISDNSTVDSPITVSGRTGNAPSNLQVSVTIFHTYQGDLKVDLVGPNGTLYNIHNRSGGGTDNVIKTVTINASAQVANGTWRLRVNDNANGDVGRIDKWSMQF